MESYIEQLVDQFHSSGVFEIAGLLSGLLCVWLLIRQSIWTWPIGLFYALISLAVFMQAKLYSEFALHIYYAAMNAYGWYYWRGDNSIEKSPALPVSRISFNMGSILVLAVLVGIPLLAETLRSFTDTDMAYADSTITVLSFAAMWMTARKQIESWYVWLLVDCIATTLYILKGIELYAVLYGVYIGMALAGWLAWRKTLERQNRNMLKTENALVLKSGNKTGLKKAVTGKVASSC